MRTINIFADEGTTVYTLIDQNFEILARRVVQGRPDIFFKLEDTYWWGEYVYTGQYSEKLGFFDYLVKKIFG